MSYQEFLSFERRGAVGIVRLARPEKLNTISAPFYEAMIELQQTEIVGDHDLRAIALLADGRHFSAGIDLNYAKAVIGKPGRSLYGVYHWQQAYRFWSECNLPVVVGIQGACMGTAIELITACDIRIAADNAKFSLREVDVGISTDLGGTTRLTKLIGPGMTKLLAMTCEDIDAQEAARIRLVERVVPLGELEQTTLAYTAHWRVPVCPADGDAFCRSDHGDAKKQGRCCGPAFDREMRFYSPSPNSFSMASLSAPSALCCA